MLAVQHCCNEGSLTRPLLLVTASVDKMVLKKPISVDTDLKIVGAVTWVGRSSLEIQLEVTQSRQGIITLLLPFAIHEIILRLLLKLLMQIFLFWYLLF